jgi:hypothetical protein
MNDTFLVLFQGRAGEKDTKRGIAARVFALEESGDLFEKEEAAIGFGSTARQV